MTCMPVDADFYVTSGYGPRDGGFHWGTDFGCPGGSGGRDVYAIRAGKVLAAGPASGFGQWVCVDHPADVGGGYSVYGHVLPKVAVGQEVAEGERIAVINPDWATNGNVAPHLHLEFHRVTWVQPGSDRLDPMTILQGAGVPETTGGTLFGVDVSEHQDGMSLKAAAAEGISFAIIRTTDGTYRDRTYRSHMQDAEEAGLITSAYHYLRNPSEGTSVVQQVEASVDVMGPYQRPVWIDVETEAGLHVDHIRDCKREFEARGIPVCGVYSYIPYYEGQVAPAEPDSHEFGALWLAWYGMNRGGTPRDIYPGDSHPKWAYPLGNQLPAIWQFGSNGHVAGFLEVDVNAFRGDRDQLLQLFKQGKQTDEGGGDMELTGVSRDALHDAKVNAQEAKDGVARLEAKVDQLLRNTMIANDQLAGYEKRDGLWTFSGWVQLGNRTLVDMLGAIGAKLKVPGAVDLAEQRKELGR